MLDVSQMHIDTNLLFSILVSNKKKKKSINILSVLTGKHARFIPFLDSVN